MTRSTVTTFRLRRETKHRATKQDASNGSAIPCHYYLRLCTSRPPSCTQPYKLPSRSSNFKPNLRYLDTASILPRELSRQVVQIISRYPPTLTRCNLSIQSHKIATKLRLVTDPPRLCVSIAKPEDIRSVFRAYRSLSFAADDHVSYAPPGMRTHVLYHQAWHFSFALLFSKDKNSLPFRTFRMVSEIFRSNSSRTAFSKSKWIESCATISPKPSNGRWRRSSEVLPSMLFHMDQMDAPRARRGPRLRGPGLRLWRRRSGGVRRGQADTR
jgi:hypothetical protein